MNEMDRRQFIAVLSSALAMAAAGITPKVGTAAEIEEITRLGEKTLVRGMMDRLNVRKMMIWVREQIEEWLESFEAFDLMPTNDEIGEFCGGLLSHMKNNRMVYDARYHGHDDNPDGFEHQLLISPTPAVGGIEFSIIVHPT